jgi:ABC-type nitrate/sulfonate/bicarbonate transport system substrate-binding protein
MWKRILIAVIGVFALVEQAASQSVRGAFPSPSIQILPMMVGVEKGFYKRERLDMELVFVRGASTAVQALLANQIHFIFSVGPQMPAVWEGNDIMLLAQQVGRPTFSLVVTPDIQKIADLRGKKIGVTFGGSTAAGTKALLDLNKINPDKDVEYISLPGNEPKSCGVETGNYFRRIAGAAGRLSGHEDGNETALEPGRYFQGHGVYRPCGYQPDDQRKSANREKDGPCHGSPCHPHAR